jgi:hypothetical protein
MYSEPVGAWAGPWTSPRPSLPSLPEPQLYTMPSVVSASVWNGPQVTCRAQSGHATPQTAAAGTCHGAHGQEIYQPGKSSDLLHALRHERLDRLRQRRVQGMPEPEFPTVAAAPGPERAVPRDGRRVLRPAVDLRHLDVRQRGHARRLGQRRCAAGPLGQQDLRDRVPERRRVPVRVRGVTTPGVQSTLGRDGGHVGRTAGDVRQRNAVQAHDLPRRGARGRREPARRQPQPHRLIRPHRLGPGPGPMAELAYTGVVRSFCTAICGHRQGLPITNSAGEGEWQLAVRVRACRRSSSPR